MSASARRWRPGRWQLIALSLAAAVASLGLLGWGVLGGWQGLTENAGNSVAAAAATSVPVTSVHCSGGSTPYSSCSDTSGNVILSWSAVTGSSGITVERATTPTGTYSPIASLAGTATGYTDTTATHNAQYYYEVFSGTPNWVPPADLDMALSLAPSAGTDDTIGTGGTNFSAANLTAMAAAGGTTYTTTTNWGATATLAGGQEPDWMGCVSTSQCWLYTNQGDIWATTTGGESWTEETTPSNPVWYGGQFVNASDGWAVGAAGTIVATTSGGATWTAQTSGTTQTINAISCVSATQCWAAGNAGVILATTNGGNTWTAQTSGTTQALEALSCVSATACWAVGAAGTVVATANGGTTWAAQTSGTTQELYGVSCVSTTHCWAAGAGGVIVASANGTSWAAQTSGTTDDLYALTCFSATACWAAGEAGVIVASTNGTSWAAQTSGTTDYIWGLDCISASQCWANGSTTTGTNGVVLVTTNGGTTWLSPVSSQYVQWSFAPTVASGSPVTSAVLTLVDDASAAPSATTRTYVLVSANSGSTWTPLSIATPTTALATQTLSLSSVIASATAVSGVELRYVVTGSNAYKSTFDLVHVDIN
ncbi:MAG: YCF48-related protein [Candidatus Dormibacteria bacterium]